MGPQPKIATVRPVESDTGAQLQARRIALGISVKALAERAGVDRGRIAALERGENVRLTTVGAVDKALADLEHEMGMDLPSQVAKVRPIGEPSEGMVEFEITGRSGVKVVVKGPVANRADLEESARRLIADMGDDPRE